MAESGVDGRVIIEIDGDSSPFDQTLATTVRQTQSLNDATIRINANASNATQEIRDVSNSSQNIPDAIVRINADISQYQEQIRQLQAEIQQLQQDANNSGEDLSKKFEDLAKRIAGFLSVLGIAAKIKEIGQAAVDSYSNYEQLVGGVETLFKESSQQVQEYAANAYKTAGISANNYMEQVTSFSASLLQSLGGNTQKAADISNQAIIDMSDNANKMGADIQSIQNAYQGFAKQNYTMLDNLKLGYGGTKAEMERLIEDANRYREESGRTADLTIENFGDIIEAIHEVQVQIGITGATAEEAEKTLEGSAKAAEAAWQNLLTALADPTQDLDQLIDDFIAAKTKQIENLLPTVEHTIEGIGQAIDHLIPELDGAGEELAKLLTEDMIPALIDALKWIADNKEIVAVAIKGMVAAAAIKGFTDLSGAIGGVFTNLSALTGNATTIVGGLENIASGAMAGVTSFNLYAAAIIAVAAAATWMATEINRAADAIVEANEHANGFSDTANDTLERYAEITSASAEQAKELSKQWIEADRAMLQASKTSLTELRKALDQMGDAAEKSGDWTQYNETYRKILEKEREVETLENLVFQEEKYYDELAEVEEKGTEKVKKAVDKGWTEIEATRAAHQSEAEKMRRQSIISAGGEEGFKEFNTYWDEITQWEKDKSEDYWAAKKAWLEEHKANQEWWWSEYHKVEAHYQKLDEDAQKQKEKEEAARQKEIAAKEKAAAQAETNRIKALKASKEAAYRDINVSAYSQTFEDDLSQTKYILDKQLEWLTSNQASLTKELYDEYYEDWLKSYESYNDKVQSAVDKEQKARQTKFESATNSIYKSTKSSIQGEIKDLQTSFDELVKEYGKGYDSIIKQRDAYKKQLMGGSVFEMIQKTDEKTGEKYTQYTIHNLKERIAKQNQLATQMQALQKRDLATGLMEELQGMDVDDALIFAKQMSQMSDEEFNAINDAYKKLDENTTKLANDFYQKDLDELNQNYVTKFEELFGGVSDDLKTLGITGATNYIDGCRLTFTDGITKVEEDIDTFIDKINQSIDDGTADLNSILEKNLVAEGFGDKMVDTIINEINSKRTDLQEAVRDLLDLEGYADTLYTGVSYQAAQQSTAGYSTATQTVNQKKTDESQTQPKNTATQTMDVTLKLVDSAGRMIAEVVNTENKRLQIGAGT